MANNKRNNKHRSISASDWLGVGDGIDSSLYNSSKLRPSISSRPVLGNQAMIGDKVVINYYDKAIEGVFINPSLILANGTLYYQNGRGEWQSETQLSIQKMFQDYLKVPELQKDNIFKSIKKDKW